MKLAYQPDARRELSEAFDYIAANFSHVAAGSFLDDVADAERLIGEFPHSAPKIGRNARRIILKRFQYQLVYRILDDEIVIYAVAHLKRKPGYWRGRLP